MFSETPRGFRDVLPSEAIWREALRDSVRDTFAAWGYMPIETPTLELADAVSAGGGVASEPISLIDEDGKLLLLRPDVTLPIARMIASRMSQQRGPFRLRYAQKVFRRQGIDQAQSREFTQLGVENIGMGGSCADAEVIALLVESLRACALESFTVAICTVDVLRSLIDGAGMPAEWGREVLSAYHESNFVALEALACREGMNAGFGDALVALPKLRGGSEAIEACKELVEPLGISGALDDLSRTWDLLEAEGAAENVVVDFSVMSGFDYYTGLVMEAYAAGFGLSLGGGGRYDNMLEAYGRTEPAAGFAFSLERVMQALRAQGQSANPRRADVLVGGCDQPLAFKQAVHLRSLGLTACLTNETDVVTEARRQGISRAFIACEGTLSEWTEGR